MIYIVIAFLWISVCLFLIMSGISFGSGIIELLTKKKYRSIINHNFDKTINPKWELNHIWLIIALFVLLVGFPNIYAYIANYLYIPLTLVFAGIILRSFAFSFRFYNKVDTKKRTFFSVIFYLSSLAIPFFLGLIGAATISGSIDPKAETFLDLYIYSWLTWFGISVGLFTTAFCAYIASIFSLYEARNSDSLYILIRKSRVSVFYILVTGCLVFIVAHYSDIPLVRWIFSKALGNIVIALATLSLLLTNEAINKKNFLTARFLACFQIIMVLIAATYQHNPDILLLANGTSLSLLEENSSPETITILGWILLLGNLIIMPFLFFLSFGPRLKKEKKA